MTNTLNIIHLPNDPKYPHRAEREKSFLKELKEQNISDYKIWDGIFIETRPRTAISRSHKMIVRDAKERKLPRVIIAEDDLQFTNKGAWDFFLKSIPEEFDVFLSHLYWGKWTKEGKVLGPFAALTLYCVHEKFYDYFLGMSDFEHIDIAINKSWRYDVRVCLPMVCRQTNGWSDNEKSYKKWDHKEIDKPIF